MKNLWNNFWIKHLYKWAVKYMSAPYYNIYVKKGKIREWRMYDRNMKRIG